MEIRLQLSLQIAADQFPSCAELDYNRARVRMEWDYNYQIGRWECEI